MEHHAAQGNDDNDRRDDTEQANRPTEEGEDGTGDAEQDETNEKEKEPQQQGILAWIDPTPKKRPPTPLQSYYGWFVCDVLLCIVVLNLAAELDSNIVVKRFSISIFTAIVLKLLLDAIEWIEHHLHHLICVQWERKLLGALAMWSVTFSSKFLFLWLDDVIFGDYIELGYVWEIVILSGVLVAVEKIARILYNIIGDREEKQQQRDGAESAEVWNRGDKRNTYELNKKVSKMR